MRLFPQTQALKDCFDYFRLVDKTDYEPIWVRGRAGDAREATMRSELGPLLKRSAVDVKNRRSLRFS
jgi:hypothetical protein